MPAPVFIVAVIFIPAFLLGLLATYILKQYKRSKLPEVERVLNADILRFDENGMLLRDLTQPEPKPRPERKGRIKGKGKERADEDT